MKEVSIVGPDLAKRVFQVHAADVHGGGVFRKKLSRNQVPAFFTGCQDASSRWKYARPRIIGRERSGSSAMKFAC